MWLGWFVCMVLFCEFKKLNLNCLKLYGFLILMSLIWYFLLLKFLIMFLVNWVMGDFVILIDLLFWIWICRCLLLNRWSCILFSFWFWILSWCGFGIWIGVIYLLLSLVFLLGLILFKGVIVNWLGMMKLLILFMIIVELDVFKILFLMLFSFWIFSSCFFLRLNFWILLGLLVLVIIL